MKRMTSLTDHFRRAAAAAKRIAAGTVHFVDELARLTDDIAFCLTGRNAPWERDGQPAPELPSLVDTFCHSVKLIVSPLCHAGKAAYRQVVRAAGSRLQRG